MSQPHTEPAPLMYCRQCGYALVGLSANRCPECGQPFEPGDPRTFCRRLGCSATHRWLRRVLLALAVLLLLMAIASGGMMGWLSHRYDRQEAIARELRRVNASFSTSYLFAWVGWTWVRHNWLLSRYTYLLNCIDDVSIARADVTDDWLACLEGLPYLRRLRLCATPHVGDAGLKHLAKLDQLESLTLEYVPISDAGLEHLQHLLHLRTLALTGTRVTGPGLRYLKGLSQLYDLDLRQTPIGDEGLACLQELTRLERVGLGDTRITDDGLAYLESLEHLCVLDVSNTRISDRGLAHLKGLTWLQSLELGNTKLTDAGLACLQGLPNLHSLEVSNTQVSVAGLNLFTGRKRFRFLVARTQVTAGDVQRLKRHAPGLEIYGP